MIRRPRRRRGVVLITAIFFMVLFFMLAFAILQLSPSDARTALREKTLTEAHFGVTSGIRFAKEWIGAVSKPGSNPLQIEAYGDSFAGGTVNIGGTTIQRTHYDIFSVPASDPNFVLASLGSLTCPYGRFNGMTGVDYLGLRPDTNLTTVDYNQMKAEQNAWPVLRSPNPLSVGAYQVYSYIVPSAETKSMVTGASASSLRTYLITSIAYRDNQPVLRARVILKEQSAADYAYRSNQNGYDQLGRPIPWNVQNAHTVLFDGPVHTNEVPWLQVPASYWDAALAYFPGDSAKERPKRAIMGSLTFSGVNATISPNFDGVGYMGGNFEGSDVSRRPFDNAGLPLPSTAQGSEPNPLSGPINNRYDRMIEGGRQSIRKIASVPLPADLNHLKAAAFGADTVTGLNTSDANPLNWGVDGTQKAGSLQQAIVTRPAYRNSSGVLQPTVTRNNTTSADRGLFVNPKSGSFEAAGGVAIKGDTRNMYLEVTDSQGKIITNVAALEAGTAVGNPTVRIQSTIDCYDSNSGTPITTYTAAGSSSGYFQPTVPGYTVPTVPASYVPTVNGVWNPTVNAYWQPGSGNQHSGTNCPSPTYIPPQGGGTAQGTYVCSHPNPGYTVPTVNGHWNPATVPGYTVPTVNAYFVPTVNGYTVAGTTQWTADGEVIDPFRYKPVDWVVDVKNVATVIPTGIPIPTASVDQRAWRSGVGTELNSGESNARQADFLGNTPGPASQRGITEVYVHTNAGDTAGTLVTSPITVPTGKLLVYKQSRSDANRLDVFVMDRPSDVTVAAQPGALNGAVFSGGDINALRGVNMDAKTIGVDYSTDKGISIMDNVWQYGTVRGEKPDDAYNGLGLVATKMNVQTRDNRFENKSLFIYATIIAGKNGANGGLDVSRSQNDLTGTNGTGTGLTTAWNFTASSHNNDNSTNTNGLSRTLTVIGGLTEQVTKARLAGTSGGSARGWNQMMRFDRQLQYRPPPFFPTTNLLVPLAYSQESVIGQ